jgi:hypothetical protein
MNAKRLVSTSVVGVRSRTNAIRRLLTLEADRAFFLALSELGRRYAQVAPSPGERPASMGLSGFELRVFSQNGEDGVLAEILRRIGAPGRFFVEFGIESGREGTCVYLADVAEWRGLFIEAHPEFYRQLERKYVRSPRIDTIHAMVTPDNIEALFKRAGVLPEPDVVSIDINGADYWVWEAITSYRPRVVVIEYNGAIDPRRRLVQPRDRTSWDGTEFFGASLAAMQTLGDGKGYRLVHTEMAGLNAFFVREDVAGGQFPEVDEAAARSFPNYFLRGYRHPPAHPGRSYLDLDSGALVSVGESHA